MFRVVCGLIALGAIFGCPPPPQPPVCVVSELPFDQLLFPGQVANVSVGLVGSCRELISGNVHVADEVKFEVFDPDDQPVAFTASAPERRGDSSSFTNTAVVTFTPQRAGPYRVTAAFEPGIGRTQQTIEAITWRGDAGFRVLPAESLPRACIQYGVTAQGTILCTLERYPAIDVVTDRGQTLVGDSFALDEDVLWRGTIRDAGIDRLVDDGGMFELTHRVANMVPGNMEARDGGLWLAARLGSQGLDTIVRHLQPEPDGGMTIEVKASVPNFYTDGMAVAEDLIVLCNSGVAPSGASIVPIKGVQRFSLPLGQFTGADEGTLWIAGNNNDIFAVQLTPALPVLGPLRVPRIVPGKLPNQALSPWSPIVRSSTVGDGGAPTTPPPHSALPRIDGTRLTFEVFDAGSEYFQVRNATRKHAFARSVDGKWLKIFDR
jgi:hypothetical protein